MPITIERVDFVPIASQDRERSKAFYTETLGLPLERETPTGFEVRAGQVTLGVWEPERMGLPFQPNRQRHLAARCGCGRGAGGPRAGRHRVQRRDDRFRRLPHGLPA